MRDYGYYDDDDPLADREPPDPPPTLEEIAHDAIAEQQERDADAGAYDDPPPAPLSVRHP
jgi:hypothetical protein